MATNEFLRWDESDTNIIDYATYLASTIRQDGFPFGSKPPSNLTNRFYRDTAGFVYAFGEMMKAKGIDASPDNLATLISNIALSMSDADTLGGLSKDYFVFGSDTHATRTDISNANSITKTSFYYNAAWTNSPSASSNGYIKHIESGVADRSIQIYMDYSDIYKQYIRVKNTTWGAWKFMGGLIATKARVDSFVQPSSGYTLDTWYTLTDITSGMGRVNWIQMGNESAATILNHYMQIEVTADGNLTTVAPTVNNNSAGIGGPSQTVAQGQYFLSFVGPLEFTESLKIRYRVITGAPTTNNSVAIAASMAMV